MLSLQDVSYRHPDGELLFEHIQIDISRAAKFSLIGNNGSGKSTLLRIIAGELAPSSGSVITGVSPYYIPQLFGQYDDLTIAQVLRIDDRLKALRQILQGDVDENKLLMLNDDWLVEERCNMALASWGLASFAPDRQMKELSGGQKTRVFLAGILLHEPSIVLLDEPSNHLDREGRELLYGFVRNFNGTLIIVSHDRTLLNLLPQTLELRQHQLHFYGGNYDLYEEQRAIETGALEQNIRNKEKEVKKAKEAERENAQRQQKLDARGKRKQEKAGLPTISMNTFRNNAEKSTARIRDVHAGKVSGLSDELQDLRQSRNVYEGMRFDFDQSALHKGKVLIRAEKLNHRFGEHGIWRLPLEIEISSGERLAITGENGSGKTTLINILLGKWEPSHGMVYPSSHRWVYVDQEYSIIRNDQTVYGQVQLFNDALLSEHELEGRLSRFLFLKDDWDKCCSVLSGGEKMRLMLCCLTISQQAPDLIVLDEPTNNLDLQNFQILTAAINEYEGTLIVVSHDEAFLTEIRVARRIELQSAGM